MNKGSLTTSSSTGSCNWNRKSPMKLRSPLAEAALSFTTKSRLRESKETAAKSLGGFLGLNPCTSATKVMLFNFFNKSQQITKSRSLVMTNKIRKLVSGQGNTQQSLGHHLSSSNSQYLRKISNKSTIKQSLMWTRCPVRMSASSLRKVRTSSSRSRANPNNPQTSWILPPTLSHKLLTTDLSHRCLFLKWNWLIDMRHLLERGIKKLTFNKMNLWRRS